MAIGDVDQGVTREIFPVSHGPIPDAESPLSSILDRRNQVGNASRSRFTSRDDPVSGCVMEPVEDLSFACIDDGCDDGIGVAHGIRKSFEARHRDHRNIQCLSHCLTCRQTDAHSREESGSDVDCDRGQFVHGYSAIAADELDGGHHDLGVMPTACRFECGDHAVGTDHSDSDPLSGSLDSENQHDITFKIRP